MERTLLFKESPYAHWEYIDNGDRLRVVPERGGLITEWRCNGKEILYFDKERFVKTDKSVRGGIPILFPICGSLPNQTLRLKQGNFLMNQHGFARDSLWEINAPDHSSFLRLRLLDDQHTKSIYPYSFCIDIEVKLICNSMQLNIYVQNTDKLNMPFSFGLHPYFKVNNLENIKIEGLPEVGINHFDMTKIRTNEQIASLSQGIDFISGPSESVLLVDHSDGSSIQLKQKKPMDLSVIWTDPPRPMVCLEPWTSPRDSLHTGDRTIILPPGKTQNLFCEISVGNFIYS